MNDDVLIDLKEDINEEKYIYDMFLINRSIENIEHILKSNFENYGKG